MTYNDKFHSDNLDQINTDLDKIEDAQNRLIDFLSKILLASNTVDQATNCECFRVLLGKIRINIESINAIIPMVRKDLK